MAQMRISPKLREGFLNTVRMLQTREIGLRPDRRFSMSDAQGRFRKLFLEAEYNIPDLEGQPNIVLPFLRRRTKVIQILSVCGILFALIESGICAAFSRETNKRICFLNVSPDEVIRSLFYNKKQDSIITVSILGSNHFNSLRCKTTRIEHIRRGQPNASSPLFEFESLKWPGFIVFDDVNEKALVYSPQDGIYKVFDLIDNIMLYSISAKDILDIKIRPGIMLLIYNKVNHHVPLKILSIKDGSIVVSFNHLLHCNTHVDFIEQFNEKLFIKQKYKSLQILDIRTSELTEVSGTEFITLSSIIFLHQNQLFLTLRYGTVCVWNFRGEPMKTFEDHLLWHPYIKRNNIYFTKEQDLIISYCKVRSSQQASIQNGGNSICISNILTGKCLAKINAGNTNLLKDCKCSGGTCHIRNGIQSSIITSTVAGALRDITAIFYDEERNEIYTGNGSSLVHVWSS